MNTTTPHHTIKTVLRNTLLFFLCATLIGAASLLPPTRTHATTHLTSTSVTPSTAQIKERYGSLPLPFEVNQGQAPTTTKFIARGAGYTLSLLPNQAVLRLRPAGEGAPTADLGLHFLGANAAPLLQGEEPLPGKSHYLVGSDAAHWQTNVATFAKVKYRALYPGIDLVYYGRQGQLEYDFVVAPGADARRIQMHFTGVQRMHIDSHGQLVLRTAAGLVRQLKPVIYQTVQGRRRIVSGQYVLLGKQRVGFQLGKYDRTLPLVIDPVLEFSTPIGGGSSEQGLGIAVDKDGNAYITGETASFDFPVAGAIQAAKNNVNDAFVLKLNAGGTAIVYATYLGGAGTDTANGIAVDADGNAYVTGLTTSANFPTTSGALQTTLKGTIDAFVAKLNPAGAALAYASYLGGNGRDSATAIALDSAGSAYLTGRTDSTDLPATGLQTTRQGKLAYQTINRGDEWEARQNGLLGFVTNAIAVNPTYSNIIYLSTGSGTYRTLNEGTLWEPLSLPSLTVSGTNIFPLVLTIAIHPQNPSIVYAAGASVFKSTDDGATWTVKNNGLLQNGFPLQVNALAIDPKQPATLYAGTSLGVYKSTDGGENWTAMNNGLHYQPLTQAQIRITELVIDPNNPNIVFAGTVAGIFKTTDGGNTWLGTSAGFATTGQLPTEVSSLALEATNPSILYASPLGGQAGVYKSLNGAMSWARASEGLSLSGVPGVAPIPVSVVVTDPKAPGTVYAGTNSGGVFKTTDGGAKWNRVSNGLSNVNLSALAIDPLTPAKIYAGTSIGNDGFVAKLNPAGSQLAYLTYLGGNEDDEGRGIAVDKDRNVYVVSSSTSPNFPLQNPLQPTMNGLRDVVVSKINPGGNALVYSTYLGGSSDDQARGIALNDAGEAYLTGFTLSPNFPTANALKVTTNGFTDAFVTKLSSDGTKLVFSTYLGGQLTDQGLGIAVDKAGDVYLTGVTNSFNFPLVNAFQSQISGSGSISNDAFVMKLDSAGSKILYSSFLGGRQQDQGNALAVDANGSAYLTGVTGSFDFPLVKPLQPFRGADLFVAKLSVAADLAITMTDSRDPVMVGNEFKYELQVTNNGPDAANNVVVTDTLPANVTVSSAVASQGSCAGTGPIHCNLGPLAQNAKATITLTLTATAVGTITNQASVTSSVFDQKMDNNTASQSTRISDKPSVLGRVVLANGEGVGRVAIAVTGTTTANATTNAEGTFQFLELPVGSNITITPTRRGYVFNPPRQTLSNLNRDQVVNFTAVPCDFTLTPSNQLFTSLGGTGSIQITSPDAQCPWTARSHDAWIKLTSPTSGMHNGTLTFIVEPTTTPRSGTITVAGKTFTVMQEVLPCNGVEFNLPFGVGVDLTPTQFVTRDFNGDNFADLAMITAAPNPTISLALNNRSGAMISPTVILTGVQPKALHSDDVNADGKMDLVMINHSAENNVYVLLGNGAGGFAAPLTFQAGRNPNWGALGDFNGDRKLDLFVGNGNPAGNGTDYFAAMYLGKGDGTFAAGRNLGEPAPFFDPARQIEVGDFNGDGKLDAVFATNSLGVRVMLGDGMGGFTSSMGGAPIGVVSLAVADFNRDGKSDYAYLFGSVARVFLGSATTDAAAYELPGVKQFAAADVNTDGKADLIGISEDGVLLRYGNGDGTFGEVVSYYTGLTNSIVQIVDGDNDGRLDVLVFGTTGSAGKVWKILRNAKDGALTAPRLYNPLAINANVFGDGAQHLFTADFNRDALDDVLAVTGGGRFAVLLGNGIGGFKTTEPINSEAGGQVVKVHDFNRDGNPDVAFLNGNTNRLIVFLGDGKGKFPMTWTVPQIPFANTFEVADFNRDGKEDLLIKTATSELSILTGNGNGGFTETVKGIAPPGNVRANQTFALGDYNGDGETDIAIVNTPTFRRCEEVQLWMLPGEGNSSFGDPLLTNLPALPELLYARDMNSDGRADLVYTETCTSNRDSVYVSFANANGSFGAPAILPVGVRPQTIAFGDLTSDGRRDIIVTNSGSGNVAILRSSVGNSFLTGLLYSAFATPGGAATGDFNGDGSLDLAVANLNTTSVAIWMNRNNCPATNRVVTTNAAHYISTKLTAESIAASFGTGLATRTETAPPGTALPTELAGTTLKIKDAQGMEFTAPLFFVSAQQVNWLIPKGVATGVATVTITSGTGAVVTGTVEIARLVPAIFSATSDGAGVLAASVVRIKPNGERSAESTFTYLAAEMKYVARELALGADELFLEIYGTGVRNHGGLANVAAQIGGVAAEVSYAGAQCCFAGLDQINVRIPKALAGRGEVEIVLTLAGRETNPLRINVK